MNNCCAVTDGIRPDPVLYQDEGRDLKAPRLVKAPSQEEYESHMRTHIPYRNWCELCVRRKSRNDPHAKGQKAAREVPMISYDYLVRSQEGTSSEEGALPVIVGVDHDTKWISAFMCKRKGNDPYAI